MVAGALPGPRRSLTICAKARGPEHPLTAASLNNLASLLQDQGDLAGARPALRAGAGDLREVLDAAVVDIEVNHGVGDYPGVTLRQALEPHGQ
jgi:hypothetical protein